MSMGARRTGSTIKFMEVAIFSSCLQLKFGLDVVGHNQLQYTIKFRQTQTKAHGPGMTPAMPTSGPLLAPLQSNTVNLPRQCLASRKLQ